MVFVHKLCSLIKKEPIFDSVSDEQLYIHLATGALVRASELAYHQSILESFMNRSDEIDDLYQKMRYVVDNQGS
ncbi:hypothetical protein QN324_05295 [Streptococcus agalactiae]|uniref:hypothetical protein n=1 Tax=Streptococcus agalactiae TaxID=1311 RepID=UPI003F14DDC1